MKTLREWIKEYETKTGETHTNPVAMNLKLYYVPDRGYCELAYIAKENCISVFETCGDAKFWHDFSVIMCKENNCKYIMTMCLRNIKAYIKLFNGKITYIEHDNNGVPIRIKGINSYNFNFTATLLGERSTAKRMKDKYTYLIKTEVN